MSSTVSFALLWLFVVNLGIVLGAGWYAWLSALQALIVAG